MFTIVKSFTFEAMHSLSHLPVSHKCSRPHGHSYTIDIEACARSLDPNGFVHDFAEFDSFREYIDTTVDHRNLNEVFGAQYTTAEHLALAFFNEAQRLGLTRVVAVRVHETARCWAEYRPI